MKDIHATLDPDMVSRIEAFQQKNDIRFFRDAVRKYVEHLELAVAAATL